jgi:hypothetical protein
MLLHLIFTMASQHRDYYLFSPLTGDEIESPPKKKVSANGKTGILT